MTYHSVNNNFVQDTNGYRESLLPLCFKIVIYLSPQKMKADK